MNIPAKPTEYKGITYRSRLEAGWAVFLDLVAERYGNLTVRYEPFTDCTRWAELVRDTGPLPGYSESEMYSIVTYNPDFLVCYEDETLSRFWMLEIKPTKVTDEYLKTLRGVAFSLALVIGRSIGMLPGTTGGI